LSRRKGAFKPLFFFQPLPSISVFYDENAKLISDPDHSEDEHRFILLGVSHSLRFILVCHCYRSEGNVIRIISARKATSKESKAYKG
jgi:uncharacterized DUF497 family protein